MKQMTFVSLQLGEMIKFDWELLLRNKLLITSYHILGQLYVHYEPGIEDMF